MSFKYKDTEVVRIQFDYIKLMLEHIGRMSGLGLDVRPDTDKLVQYIQKKMDTLEDNALDLDELIERIQAPWKTNIKEEA
jgi:hypothetical protein